MNEKLEEYEQAIKRKHRFGFPATYTEDVLIDLDPIVAISIVVKTVEKLGWEVMYKDKTLVGALRKKKKKYTEKISIRYEPGKIRIKSASLKDGWDRGKNSKRVKLFIHVFQQTIREYDEDTLLELQKEFERSWNWDDYVIPETLPKPKKIVLPKPRLLFIGGIIIALLLGGLLAFLSIKKVYIPLFYEIALIFIIDFVLKKLMRYTNCTRFSVLHGLVISMVIVVYVSNAGFQVLIADNFNSHVLKAGFAGTGKTVFIYLIIQIVVTYLIVIIRLLTITLPEYVLGRVPREVMEFAYYHFVKGKTETEVRNELARMGRDNEQSQNEVLESIWANREIMETNKGRFE